MDVALLINDQAMKNIVLDVVVRSGADESLQNQTSEKEKGAPAWKEKQALQPGNEKPGCSYNEEKRLTLPNSGGSRSMIFRL